MFFFFHVSMFCLLSHCFLFLPWFSSLPSLLQILKPKSGPPNEDVCLYVKMQNVHFHTRVPCGFGYMFGGRSFELYTGEKKLGLVRRTLGKLAVFDQIAKETSSPMNRRATQYVVLAPLGSQKKAFFSESVSYFAPNSASTVMTQHFGLLQHIVNVSSNCGRFCKYSTELLKLV